MQNAQQGPEIGKVFSVCQLLWLSIIFPCGSVTLSCSLFFPSLLFSKDPLVDRRESYSCISCSCPCSRSQTLTSLGIKAKFQNVLKALSIKSLSPIGPLVVLPRPQAHSHLRAWHCCSPCLRSPSPCPLPSSLPWLRCQLPGPWPRSPPLPSPLPTPRFLQPCFSSCFP